MLDHHNKKIELSRAHTPHTSAASDRFISCIDLNPEPECVDDLYLHITLNYCAHEQKVYDLHVHVHV